jgi:hypothetical protein
MPHYLRNDEPYFVVRHAVVVSISALHWQAYLLLPQAISRADGERLKRRARIASTPFIACPSLWRKRHWVSK